MDQVASGAQGSPAAAGSVLPFLQSTFCDPSNEGKQESGVSWSNASLDWYAVYTRSRHERAVEKHLSSKGIRTFLPLVQIPRRWSDRWQKVSLPLFPGYLFVRVCPRGRLDVLRTPGIVHIVGNGDGPVPVPDEQIEAVSVALRSNLRCDPHPFLSEGQRVRVVNGPLSGFEGVLVRKKSRYRLVLLVELIRKAVALEISAADVAAA